MTRISSISIDHSKNTMNSRTQKMPVPKKIFIPMSMSAGVSCEALVKPEEHVLAGQKIGEAVDPMAVPIHSSVSGVVQTITDYMMPNNIPTKMIEIKTDASQKYLIFSPPTINNKEDLVEAVKASGMVGLGGAAFPTNVKLSATDLDTLIVNAAECEPYITSDYRTIVEDLDNVVCALEYIKKFCGIKNIIFGVESNKPQAINLINKIGKYSVKILKSRYPQGAEKILIYETTRKVLPEGKRPNQIGVVVLNVTTLAKLGLFFNTGEPLMTKRVTVDGNAVKKPQNIETVIGTPISEVLDFCGLKTEAKKIILGGPMMGISVSDSGFPVIKSTNAVLAFDEKKAKSPDITPCIRCGRCYRSCPFHLMPAEFERRYYSGDVMALKELHIASCIECGVCAYVCPAKRDLVATNRLSKNMVKGREDER